MSQTDTLISVQDLAHTYLRGTPFEVPSLRGVSLTVAAGTTVGLVGPTGSGKSTLLQHLNGLLRPQEGTVHVLGDSLTDPSINIRDIRQRVGLVFQNPEDQLFEPYAGDDVAFGPRALGLERDQVRERVRQAMEAVGLSFDLKDRLTSQLSQGERRRLALAGVLALEPQILVLDEPTAGLDPLGRRSLLDFLSSWASDAKRAIVLATHNMEDIALLSDDVYVLVAGKIVLSGPARTVLQNADVLLQSSLSLPVSVELSRQLRRRGLPVSTDSLTMDEATRQIEVLLRGDS